MRRRIFELCSNFKIKIQEKYSFLRKDFIVFILFRWELESQWISCQLSHSSSSNQNITAAAVATAATFTFASPSLTAKCVSLEMQF